MTLQDDGFLRFATSLVDDMKKCKLNLHFVTCPICNRYIESTVNMRAENDDGMSSELGVNVFSSTQTMDKVAAFFGESS